MIFKEFIGECVRDMMKPKSSKEVVELFDGLSLHDKSQLIYDLYKTKFRRDNNCWVDFIKTKMGISFWNRVEKYFNVTHPYVIIVELVKNLKKHEIERLLLLMLEKDNITNESVRSLMKPIADEELRENLIHWYS